MKLKLLLSFFLLIIFSAQLHASNFDDKIEASSLLIPDEQSFDIIFENLSRDEVLQQAAKHASCFAGGNEIITKNNRLRFRTVDNIEIGISLWDITGSGSHGLRFENLDDDKLSHDAFLNYRKHFIDHLGPLDLDLEGLEHFYLNDHDYFCDTLVSS